jgi:very-short-patch-repair endonuclease
MPYTSTSKIRKNAKELRKNLTPVEEKLWVHLRGHRMGDVQFRRQHAIGNYIVDFCAPSKKLVIELDGGQHLEQAEYDKERTTFLNSKGYKVLRFWNNDVMNDLDAVLTAIWNVLREEQ